MAIPRKDREEYEKLWQEAYGNISGHYVEAVLKILADKGYEADSHRVYNTMRRNSSIQDWEILKAVRTVLGLPARPENKLTETSDFPNLKQVRKYTPESLGLQRTRS